MTSRVEHPQKIYFVSDVHLGYPNHEQSLIREKKLIAWLETIRSDAAEIFLVGDIFDFWFDYKKSVPRYFTRLLGKIAELTDDGIPIHYFCGNHDIWLFDYFEKELGVKIYREPIYRTWNEHTFLIAHGDGLGPGDHGYKFLKKIFTNKICQTLFQWLHPDIGISIAQAWSRKSHPVDDTEEFLGEEKEWLILYAKEQLKNRHFDYFIFGHRHIPLEIKLNEKSTYINLGDWITHFSYAVFDGEELLLREFNSA